ncbi:hypothetical protein SAMN04515671_3503 [Nakamurella panacisegetis]|uniref:Uncharacterized protein n=1 Tax=Nakamurella panacisegetis TaxID=1090615 RepID=A0A1H0RE31_9ACTN|nr:hypothetical protein [Nakamurella panacisegetis]SDP27306.1 hypothetical protein SAMN04515671_3503 [Nakamurella panacisegetis]
MSRLYTLLNAVLLIGGVAALAFTAWPLGIVLVLLGGAGLTMEIRARRPAVHVVLDSGPDATMQKALARAFTTTNAANQARSGMEFTAGL